MIRGLPQVPDGFLYMEHHNRDDGNCYLAHPPIPDFRIEASCLKVIGPFVHWKRPWTRHVKAHINDLDNDDECRECHSNGKVWILPTSFAFTELELPGAVDHG